MIDTARLIQKAAVYGIDAAPIADLLDQYAELLVNYNQKVNLTAITEPEAIEDKHFIDSLLLAACPEVRGALTDVGTGAGFPGIVTKLYCPSISLTLMEPTGKRMDFLRLACEALHIEAEFAKERAEEAARKRWRESFDTATARAVAPLPILCEYCLPLLRPGGHFLAMKGSDAAREVREAAPAAARLGGTFRETRAFTLPDGSARTILIYEKTSPTPAAYPRNGGKIAKAPLR